MDLAQLTATHLTLSFNYPARWVQETNVTWGCHALFDTVTAGKLGLSPGCSMSEDLVRLQVVLGERSYLQVGDLVTLLFGVFVPASGVYLPTEMESTVTTEEPAVAVHAVLVAPDISPVCARLRFSTALSTGFAGRAPSVSWRFGNGTHEDLGSLLQPALAEASDYAEQVLEIPPETLFAAVSEVQANGSNWSEMVLEVVSTITNWHGEQDEATAVLTVLNAEEPLPQIVPVMLSELEFLPSEVAEMAVQVYPTETASYCVDSIRRSGRVDTIVREEGNETWIETLPPEPVAPADPGVIRIRWEYRRLDDGACVWVSRAGNESNETENASNATNLSEGNSTGNFSCAMMFWQPLENLRFANRARDPSALRFSAFALPPNSSHQFRASAFREDLEDFSNRSAVTYTLSVLPRSRPMVSVIGPPAASASCAFALRAEAWEGPPFEYAWSCLVGDMAEMNESEAHYAERCLPRLAHWAGPELRVQAGELEEDTYTFRVHARRPGPGEEWSEAYWSVKVGMEPWPRVALTVPWRSNEALSTASQDVRAVAEVMGSSSCPVPMWTWQWVLVSASSTILALLRTTNESSLEEPLGNTSLSTADFRSHLLRSGHRYAYALVAHDASSAAAQLHLMENSTLQHLESVGAFVSWSHFFLADGPPAFGVVESTPRSGYAVSSLFTLNTFGWFDELEDGISYAFFRFPLENIPGLGADSLYDAAPGNDVEWRLPYTDWHNVSSPAYFQRQGGLLLRPWDRAKSVSDVILAAGSYYLVVCARDALGAEGVASVLGPVVSEPAFLSARETTNALKVAAASSNADRILNAVDAALSVPVSDSFESSLLEAMEVAASVVAPSPEALEKMSYAVSSVVQGGRTGMGLLVNKSQLSQAAGLLDSCIDLALESPESGVGVNLGVAMLEGISSVNLGARMGQNSSLNESANLSTTLETLTSKLADASLALMRLGESKSMTSSDGDSGMALELSRITTMNFRGGLAYGRLSAPRKVELLTRRLQMANESCDAPDALDVKLTFWQRNNPYSWADPAKAMNRLVTPNNTVAVLQLELCGSPVTFNDTDPDAAVEVRDIDLPAKPPPVWGYWLDVACARWSPRDQSWVFDGVEVKQPVYNDDVKVTCRAFYGGAAYAAVWLPVEVTTSTTTLEWTYPAYTTFFVPSLPPVYVVSCNETLLPDPPAGSWDCTKPGEGQECRAPCFGFPNNIFSMTCLKGADSLEWFTTNFCPVFSTTTTYEEVRIPAEEAVTGGLLIFVWVVLVTCSAGVAALVAYGGYRFAQKEQRRRSHVSHVVFPDDEVEENPVDPRFMDWAKQWAERPAVAESAVLEMKHKASSHSQSSLALEDQGAGGSPEHPNAAEDEPDGKVSGPSAFTGLVELEYSEDWREELDELLLEREIPRQTEGRLYYVVNCVREVLQTKDLEELRKPNFPLKIHFVEDVHPTVDKSDAFYAWQVEWGALRQGEDPDLRGQDPPKKEVVAVTEAKQTFDVPKLPVQHQQHQDLMKRWQEQNKLRSAANPKLAPSGKSPKSLRSGSDASDSPPRRVDPVQEVFDRYQMAGLVASTERFGGALADTAAQASVLVPELQESFYEDEVDQGWLEVQSPSGRIYYWNQITQEVWDPPEDVEFTPE